ncbi:hypothetical protein LPW11_20355 [Geomonas sp. RF6]|uniref:hypothetical protein n=1 Tax=Geomonas sp. RF6 TaxID=2897342 RepID=UPI001E58EC9C|nr:hypothetical protein [Geomonas sp. RF6]UFS70213.1 hypothetical protein LPW11_20355 [Geomonas sp. RF6]
METRIEEIFPGTYRLSTYVAKIDLQFNQFLVDDDEPLLYHTGMKGLFPYVGDAVAKILDPARICWIGFSHFESDECGSLNEWLSVAPDAKPVCGTVGALVNINDFIGGRAHVLADGETFSTGRHRFRFLETPHVPHAWDASLLFEETEGTLYCSDLFLQNGSADALTEVDIVPSARQALAAYQAGPLANPYPYSPLTGPTLQRLAQLKPRVLAAMHGSSFRGDCAAALDALARVYAEMLGAPREESQR